MADFVRETAHRLFAQEFRQSNVNIPGEGERDASYVISPIGAKINRLHVVGVCTEVEPVGENGDVFRARISDPTGIFTVYAGQYQPEAAQVLSELEPPCFLAVTGKARTFEPEDGSVFTSIRPERITVVDEATRDQWLLDTARRTKERLDQMDGSSDGVMLARQHYGTVDKEPFVAMMKLGLEGLLPGGTVEVQEFTGSDDGGFSGQGADDAPAWTPPTQATTTAEADPAADALDDQILAIVQRLSGTDGVQWDDILSEAGNDGTTADDVEESLNRLMDKGLVYEPTLGVLKTT